MAPATDRVLDKAKLTQLIEIFDTAPSQERVLEALTEDRFQIVVEALPLFADSKVLPGRWNQGGPAIDTDRYMWTVIKLLVFEVFSPMRPTGPGTKRKHIIGGQWWTSTEKTQAAFREAGVPCELEVEIRLKILESLGIVTLQPSDSPMGFVLGLNLTGIRSILGEMLEFVKENDGCGGDQEVRDPDLFDD